MGFMDGIRDVLGGFNAVKQIDSDGFDWREKRAAQQAARDQELRQYEQANQDYEVKALAEAQLGGMGDEDLPLAQALDKRAQTAGTEQGPTAMPDLGAMRRRATYDEMIGARARGQSAQSKSSLEGQRAYTAEALERLKGANRLDVADVRGEAQQEAIRLREKLARERTLSPADQARLNSLERMNSSRIAAGDRRAGGSLSRRPTKVGGMDDQGRAGTWLIYPDNSREFMPASATAGTRGKEEAKGAAMLAYNELMDVYDTIGGQPDDGLEARATGLVRSGAAKMGYDPETSTYQGGVRGFVPLMARALGHVGVLTELDVERTEALFPKVGDTEAEKSKKKRLLSEIMVGARPLPFRFEHDTREEEGGAPPPAGGGRPPQPPVVGGGPKVGDKKTFKNGRTGVWDGKGWKAVQ